MEHGAGACCFPAPARNSRLGEQRKSLLQSPDEIGQSRDRENDQDTEQATGNPVNGRSQSEVHANMSESAGYCLATCLNLARAGHPCSQNQTDRGPNRLESLTDSSKPDSPSHEKRRAKINRLACLKIEIS